jgi:lipopolysaccharide export LptBFGC system permease protein LptF
LLILGCGVFTRCDFGPGDFLLEYRGEIISAVQEGITGDTPHNQLSSSSQFAEHELMTELVAVKKSMTGDTPHNRSINDQLMTMITEHLRAADETESAQNPDALDTRMAYWDNLVSLISTCKMCELSLHMIVKANYHGKRKLVLFALVITLRKLILSFHFM